MLKSLNIFNDVNLTEILFPLNGKISDKEGERSCVDYTLDEEIHEVAQQVRILNFSKRK
jgi:hypothetical protein